MFNSARHKSTSTLFDTKSPISLEILIKIEQKSLENLNYL